MTASGLHRQLLFYGYDEVTDFLKNSPLNRHIYKKYLDLLPERNIEVPMVRLFNEIYFQCVRVNYDGQPGMDVNQRYINECSSWLNSQSAAESVFAVVWAILKNKPINYLEECFLDQLTHYIKKSDFYYFSVQLSQELQWVSIPESFPTLTSSIECLPELLVGEKRRNSLTGLIEGINGEPINYEAQMEELREYQKAWKRVTCNFSHNVIEKLVQLYTSPSDQLQLIERIEDAFVREDFANHTDFIKQLVAKIKTGNFGEPLDDIEYQEYLHNLAMHNAVDDEELTREEELEQQCEALKRQIEELKTSHELEIAKLEQRYQTALQPQETKPSDADIQPTGVEQDTMPIGLKEMIEYVKLHFTKTNADAFVLMLYRMAQAKKITNEDYFILIDSIDAAIQKRDAMQQSFNFNDTVTQVNVNSQVENKQQPHE